jgi:hypothetical protein
MYNDSDDSDASQHFPSCITVTQNTTKYPSTFRHSANFTEIANNSSTRNGVPFQNVSIKRTAVRTEEQVHRFQERREAPALAPKWLACNFRIMCTFSSADHMIPAHNSSAAGRF